MENNDTRLDARQPAKTTTKQAAGDVRLNDRKSRCYTGREVNRRDFLARLALAPSAQLLERAARGQTPLPIFRDIAEQSGVRFVCHGSPTSQKYLIETMAGGVAMFDYDLDGRLDLFFVNGAALSDPMTSGKQPDKSDPRYWNRLYHNNGDGTFSDVTEAAGVKGHSFGQGVAVGDYDNDGRPDLYVTNFGQNILYHNNGDGTFTDVTSKAGVAGGGWSASACFVDYDRDGWLDLLVSRYLQWDFGNNPYCGSYKPGGRAYCHPNQFKPATHLLFHNNRDGTFTDVSEKSGIAKFPGNGLGVSFNDYDRDGWPDLLVSNDNSPQQLFRNLGNGKFEETGLASGLAYDENGRAFSGMGVDFADYNNDGWPDVFIGDLANERYALFENRKGAFVYQTGPSGLGAISSTHSGWGLKFFDYDNDGWKDLFIAQGHVMDTVETAFPGLRYLEPPVLIRNNKGVFQDVSALGGAPFRVARAARGAAFGDLDNDGRIEIAVNNLNGPASILKSSGGKDHHWLMVNTIGSTSNRDGIGAAIRIVSESGKEQYDYVSTTGSYMSANDKRVHFGLGLDRLVALLEVSWPSGVVQRLEKIPANQIINVKETPGSTARRKN